VTRCHPNIIRKRDTYCGRGVMIWAGTIQDTCSLLHVIHTGSVNAQRHRQEILKPYKHFFRGAVYPQLIFMNDSAKSHEALLANDYLVTLK